VALIERDYPGFEATVDDPSTAVVTLNRPRTPER
jgi:hypothetical protein